MICDIIVSLVQCLLTAQLSSGSVGSHECNASINSPHYSKPKDWTDRSSRHYPDNLVNSSGWIGKQCFNDWPHGAEVKE